MSDSTRRHFIGNMFKNMAVVALGIAHPSLLEAKPAAMKNWIIEENEKEELIIRHRNADRDFIVMTPPLEIKSNPPPEHILDFSQPIQCVTLTPGYKKQ